MKHTGNIDIEVGYRIARLVINYTQIVPSFSLILVLVCGTEGS